MNFYNELTAIYGSGRNHAFVLHGSTRDLQVGAQGSTHLPDFLMQTLFAQGFTPAVYRIGVGWRFLVDSHQSELTGLIVKPTDSDPFAALTGGAGGDQSGDDELPTDIGGAVEISHQLMMQSTSRVAVIMDRAEFIAAGSPYTQMQPQDKNI